jgi:hypothetical protein
MTFRSRHISVSIDRPVEEVYQFASNPETWPQWAAGLSGSMENSNGEWIAKSPMGTVKVEFSPKNNFGILDHRVALPSGEIVYNPMRVFPNGDGSELVFTVYQRPGVSTDMFAGDADAVKRDLQSLKTLLEGNRATAIREETAK